MIFTPKKKKKKVGTGLGIDYLIYIYGPQPISYLVSF